MGTAYGFSRQCNVQSLSQHHLEPFSEYLRWINIASSRSSPSPLIMTVVQPFLFAPRRQGRCEVYFMGGVAAGGL